MELERKRPIEEDYCSFEVGELLSECGFNEDILFYYSRDDKTIEEDSAWTRALPQDYYPCCTHQRAMKWLREKKNIYIQIRFSGLVVPVTKYVVDILDAEGNWIDNNLEERTYYDIVESTLKFCLSCLVKNNRG